MDDSYELYFVKICLRKKFQRMDYDVEYIDEDVSLQLCIYLNETS